MRRIVQWAALCLISLSVTLSASTSAQIGGSRLNKVATRKDAGKVSKRWAACVVNLNAGYVESLLDTLPGSKEEADVGPAGAEATERCVTSEQLIMDGQSLRMSPGRVRALLAEAYLLTPKGRKPFAQVRADGASAWLDAKLKAREPSAPVDRQMLITLDMMACLAEQRLSDLRAVLATEAGSPAETAGISTIMQYAGPCLQQGAKLKADPVRLRMAIAEVVYHAATAKPLISWSRPISHSRTISHNAQA